MASVFFAVVYLRCSSSSAILSDLSLDFLFAGFRRAKEFSKIALRVRDRFLKIVPSQGFRRHARRKPYLARRRSAENYLSLLSKKQSFSTSLGQPRLFCRRGCPLYSLVTDSEDFYLFKFFVPVLAHDNSIVFFFRSIQRFIRASDKFFN